MAEDTSKTEVFRVRMTPDEKRALNQLAQNQNTTASDAARTAIKTALNAQTNQPESKPAG